MKDIMLRQIQTIAGLQFAVEIIPVQEDHIKCRQVNPGNMLALIIPQDIVPVHILIIVRIHLHPEDLAEADHPEVQVPAADQEVQAVAVAGIGDNYYETLFSSL